MTRRRLVVIGPVPPPSHGVAISTSLVLANPLLHRRFDVEHLDTSDPRSLANIGRWDWTNVRLGLEHSARLAFKVVRHHRVVYLPLSENLPGYLRDSLFIVVASAAGSRVAIHVRNSEFQKFYRSRGRVIQAWIRFSLRRATSVAVLGRSLIPLFQGLYPTDRIVVVENGTPDIGSGPTERAPTVLFLSNLRRAKGFLVALDCAALVLERHPDVRFVFAGEWGDPDVRQEALARTRKLGDRVSILPAVSGSQKVELLQSAAVLLCPTIIGEGQPRVILEAMAAGTPIIATDRGAVRDTVEHGVTGYVLPDPVPAQLASRIIALLADANHRQSLGAAARAHYLKRFTQERADARLADWLSVVAR
jgi:glycosyltransferase involved in cell wall biosynthesis